MAHTSTVARAIRAIGVAIAVALAIAVVLVVVDANEDNGLVGAVIDVGRFFAEPFRQIIELDDNDLQIAINWGIAAAVYVALALALAAGVRFLAARGER